MRFVPRPRHHDERARHHLVNRVPQAGSADTAVDAGPDAAESGFQLTAPLTITVIVPPTPIVTNSRTTSTISPPSTVITPSSLASSSPSSSSTTRATTSSSPPTTVAQPSISVLPPTSSTAEPSEETGNEGLVGTNGALNTGSGLPTGAIVGIVIAVLLVIIGIVVLLLRKKNLFARKKRRATWLAKGGIMGPKPIEGYDTILPFTTEKPPPPPRPTSTYNPGLALDGAVPTSAGIAPPPSSYNNPPTFVTPPAMVSAAIPSEGTPATVVCTFVPSLPDELTIVTGEVLHVISEYDDGWALCANSREERGMVPIECLDKSRSLTPVGDVRDVRRTSSLAPAPIPLAPNRFA